MDDHDHTKSTATNSDILVPTDTDKQPIVWPSNNDAHLEGTLYEVGRYLKRTGIFGPFLEHHAVLVGTKMAIDSPQAIPYILGWTGYTDPRSYDNPSPASVKRSALHSAATTKAGTTAPPPVTVIPDEHKHSFVVQPFVVTKEDSRFLTLLNNVFGTAECWEEIVDEADGSGLAALKILRERAAAASPQEKALVSAEHAKVVRDGVVGELTLDSFKAFLKAYKHVKRCSSKATRQSTETEVEMINLIAYKDPSIREIFDTRSSLKAPKNFEEATLLVKEILRRRIRNEELDTVNAGGGPPRSALGVTGNGHNGGGGPPGGGNAPTAGTIDALVAAIGKLVDPKKTHAGQGGADGKVSPPRDENRKITHWIPGMTVCDCGGEHLFRDCPKKKQKDAEKAATKRQKDTKGSKANKAAQSALLSLLGSLGDASELQAFLTSAQPCEEHESGVPGGSDE